MVGCEGEVMVRDGFFDTRGIKLLFIVLEVFRPGVVAATVVGAILFCHGVIM